MTGMVGSQMRPACCLRSSRYGALRVCGVQRFRRKEHCHICAQLKRRASTSCRQARIAWINFPAAPLPAHSGAYGARSDRIEL